MIDYLGHWRHCSIEFHIVHQAGRKASSNSGHCDLVHGLRAAGNKTRLSRNVAFKIVGTAGLIHTVVLFDSDPNKRIDRYSVEYRLNR